MAGIATAIGAAAVVGAAGVVVAGSEAASATTSAANTAANVQEQALAQEKALSAPYTGLGQSAIPQLEQLLGLTGPNGQPANAQTVQQTLANTPGYEFAKEQGLQGVQNSAAGAGMLKSGNTLQALDTFGTGLANQTYQQTIGNLEQTVGLGQAAAAGQAANIQTGASNLGNIAIGQGNTLAGIDANTIAGITGAIGNAGNQYVLANTLKNLNAPPASSAADTSGIYAPG